MPAILFDLDGTLVDSAPTIALRLNAALRDRGYDQVAVDAVRPLLGNDAAQLVAAAIKSQGGAADPAACVEISKDFLSRYRDDPVEGSLLYPDCRAVLESLKDAGNALAICTNKPEITALPVLARMDLGGYFDCVLCGDRAAVKKPDGRHILEILDRMGAARDGAVMVGDSSLDIRAANDAAVTGVLARYGYDPEGGAAAGPTHTIDRLRDVLDIVRKPASTS